ncbi:sugar transferase [Sporosarcina sp. ACRSL]|uniref:sugar transferase n=1 Tax=Sporosarcina sp. ACRSL TaxID=2918215 RepID=UPI001EF4A70E|nr:sugar transferase [Sporosarcina sp. ACRSL]MCG7345500.1 sugar transferase [Sporosarcina sp. ACRSL]
MSPTNLDVKNFVEKPFNDLLKRMFDFLVSFIFIIILFPLFVIIAVLIKKDSDGPILFKQVRVGKNDTLFEIYKFRTMVVDAEKIGKQITVGKDSRITRSGDFLRRYKLDELPQLFNVLKGEMSFVGPRPEVPKYTRLYNEEQRNVLKVRPGITDYASIKYRRENELLARSDNPEETYIKEVMQDKLQINLEYINKRSIFEDIRIMFLTIIKILN